MKTLFVSLVSSILISSSAFAGDPYTKAAAGYSARMKALVATLVKQPVCAGARKLPAGGNVIVKAEIPMLLDQEYVLRPYLKNDANIWLSLGLKKGAAMSLDLVEGKMTISETREYVEKDLYTRNCLYSERSRMMCLERVQNWIDHLTSLKASLRDAVKPYEKDERDVIQCTLDGLYLFTSVIGHTLVPKLEYTSVFSPNECLFY